MGGLVIVLNGPVGVGKTTTGQAVARALHPHVAFIDGDSFGSPAKPWLEKIEAIRLGIVEAAIAAFAAGKAIALVAYPLRDEDWAYLHASLSTHHIELRVITLAASLDAIACSGRSRALTDQEVARSAEMIAEGYATRPFSDLFIDTGANPLACVVAAVSDIARRWMGRSGPRS